MANPRQRKKLRSGSFKPVHHSRHAKKIRNKQPPIRGPRVLQESWDKHKTVRQNYATLGLVPFLNPTPSGGVERPLIAVDNKEPVADASTPEASSSQQVLSANTLPKGYGRIVRDADGNIVHVQLPDEEREAPPEDETMDDLPDPAQDEQLAPWIGLGSNPQSGQSGAPSTHVVRALEEMSSGRVRLARFTSARELATLRRLVSKHGHDVEAMARDRKLNPDQRTAGGLGRAIKKAGGFGEMSKGV